MFSSRILKFLNIALAVLLLYAAANMLLPAKQQGSPSELAREPAPASQSVNGTAAEKAPDAAVFEALSKLDIFGTPAPPPLVKPVEQTPEQPVPQPLSLKLRGTIAGDTVLARAIIEEASTKGAEIYKVGDEVQGARITAIERNRVTLDRDGRRYVLGVDVADAGAVAAVTELSLPPMTTHAHDLLKFITPSEIQVNRSAAIEALGGIDSIMRVVKISPHVDGDKTVGLKLSGLDQIPLARFAGFKEGDVIQNVNGQDLTSINKAIQVMRKARNMSRIDVTILRGDTTHNFNFELK